MIGMYFGKATYRIPLPVKRLVWKPCTKYDKVHISPGKTWLRPILFYKYFRKVLISQEDMV